MILIGNDLLLFSVLWNVLLCWYAPCIRIIDLGIVQILFSNAYLTPNPHPQQVHTGLNKVYK